MKGFDAFAGVIKSGGKPGALIFEQQNVGVPKDWPIRVSPGCFSALPKMRTCFPREFSALSTPIHIAALLMAMESSLPMIYGVRK
jgi:hypothetical protein